MITISAAIMVAGLFTEASLVEMEFTRGSEIGLLNAITIHESPELLKMTVFRPAATRGIPKCSESHLLVTCSVARIAFKVMAKSGRTEA